MIEQCFENLGFIPKNIIYLIVRNQHFLFSDYILLAQIVLFILIQRSIHNAR